MWIFVIVAVAVLAIAFLLCWQAVGEDARAYSNIIADANELIRLVLLYVDRSHNEDGYYSIFRHLRSLPEGGCFPEWYISRFRT